MAETKVCQGCLSSNNLLLLNNNFLGQNYGNLFQKCFNLKIGAEYPFGSEWICKECVDKLHSANEFRSLVEKSQKYLKDNAGEVKEEKIKTDLEVELDLKQEDNLDDYHNDDDFFRPADSYETFDIEDFKVKVESQNLTIKRVKPKKEKKVEEIKTKDTSKPPKLSLKDILAECPPPKKRRKIVSKPAPKVPKTKEVEDDEDYMPLTEVREKEALAKVKKPTSTCGICRQKFDTSFLLCVHKINEHKSKGRLPECAFIPSCDECGGHAFDSVEIRNEHMIGYHGLNSKKVQWDTRNVVRCTECGHYFPDYSSRFHHLRSHPNLAHKLPDDMRVGCTECSAEYNIFVSEVVHVYNKHNKREIQLPPGGSLLKCDICDLLYFKQSSYRRHMAHFHKVDLPDKRPNRCKICGVFFVSKTDWNKHLPAHNLALAERKKNDNYSYKCKICEEKFPLKSIRKKHYLTVHNFSESLPCEVCGLGLSSLTALRKHLRTHTKEITAYCDYCGHGCRDKYDLPAHFKTHSELKLYKCEICSKDFKTSGNLRQHVKIHYEKQHSCGICGQKFTHRYNMKSHMTRNHNQGVLGGMKLNPPW